MKSDRIEWCASAAAGAAGRPRPSRHSGGGSSAQGGAAGCPEADPLGVDIANAHDYQWPPSWDRSRLRGIVGFGTVIVAVLVQLAACQWGSSATLADRAKKYWELKQQKRWEEVYDGYLDPAAKSALARDSFLKKRLLAFDILDFNITDVAENGNEGTVHVTSHANIPLRGIGGKTQLRKQEMTGEEAWVRHDGAWYIRLSE
jgi:hypothetical protein